MITIFASEHFETFGSAFFPPKKVLSDSITVKLFMESTKSIIAYSTHKKIYRNIDSHFPSLLFVVKPELTREEYQVPWISASAIPTAHSTVSGATRFLFFYLLKTDEAFFGTRRDEIRAWTGQRMWYCGLIQMDGSFLYITLSPSFPTHPDGWCLLETGLACPHSYLINKSKTSLIPSLLDRNLILQVQSIETRMHFSIANYMLWGWYQPQSFREFRCYSSIQKIVHINFIEFSFIIKLKLNIEFIFASIFQ